VKAKIFRAKDNEGRAIIEDSAQVKLEYRLNKWLAENPNIEVEKMEQTFSGSHISGESQIALTLLYNEKE